MPTARISSRSRRIPSSMLSRCSHLTDASLSGRPTATGRCRERRISSSPTGLKSRESPATRTKACHSSTPSEARQGGSTSKDREGGSDRMGKGDWCCVADLDRAALVSRRGIPYSLGEHGKHAPRRRLPLRQQGGVRG